MGPGGPQPLSISDIYALTKMMGLYKTDDLEFILLIVPMLDQIYLNKVYADKEKEAAKRKKAAENKRPPRRGR